MPINILIVEDDIEQHTLFTYGFRERVQRGELAFHFAYNGREALEKLAASPDIDLVISNIDMPEMDGLTLLSHLQEQYPLIRAIMMTGYCDMRTIRAAMNRGAYDFLSKPFHLKDLETTLNRAIREAQRVRREAAERQQTQQKLLELQQALETVPVGVTVVNLDGQIVYTNPADARMHGYEAAELIGQDVSVLTRPELRHRVKVEEIQKWQGFVRESINVRRNGQAFPVWLMSEIVKGKDGMPQAIVTTCEDITDRKQAEVELLAAQTFAQATIDALTAHICVIDEQGVILAVNQAWRTFADANSPIAGQYFLGENYLSVCDSSSGQNSEEAAPFAEGLRAVIRMELSHFTVEYTCDAPNEARWFHASVSRFLQNDVVRVVIAHENITARKQAEEALRQLNQELEQRVAERTAELADLYDHAPCGYHSLNPDGLILRMNQTELDWLGYTRDEVIGQKHFPELLTPESQHAFFANFQRFKQLGCLTNQEFDLVRKDGTIFSVLINGTALYDEQGRFLMSRCTLINHTDRKRIELALAESERNFRAFFDTIDYLFFVLDAQGIILRVNAAVCRLLEYHEDDLIGMNILELHLRERREEAAAILAAMMAGSVDACPVPLVTQSGRVIPVETRVFRGTWSGQPVLFGITKDISELQASEEKFAKAFYTAPALMALSQLEDGRFIDVNDAFVETLGYTRSEVIGHTSLELHLFVDIAQRAKILQNIASSGSIQNFEIVARSKSGQIRYGLFSADLLYLQDRQVLLTAMVDVTERKQAEVELARARDAANAANRAKSEFLANMSHELRTPLNAILGYAQILQKADNLTERQHEGVRTIRESGEYLLQLITDILDMSKIEAGRMELQLQEFRLPDVLNRLSQMIQVRAEQKQLEFVYIADPDLPEYVIADERKLRQVLLNLLGNAVKFTDHGRVTLRVAKLNAPLIERSRDTQPPGVSLCFEVIDTGIGMMEEDLSTLFVPFRQLGERRAALEGTGLGLAISAKLVALMGGQMHVTSAIGQGSRFWFDLPITIVTSPTVAMSPHHAEILGYVGAIRSVLIIDDKPANLAILANMLEPLGFHLLKATSGQAGLHTALTQHPDIILLDLRMPEMDGFEVMRRLRADPVGQELTVIAVSASVQSDIRQRSLDAGCRDFLEKPVMFENLCALLEKYLDLTWIYAHSEHTIFAKMPDAAEVATLRQTLSSDLLDRLINAAERGDARLLITLAEQGMAQESSATPLLKHIRQLASNFQVDEIATILRDRET